MTEWTMRNHLIGATLLAAGAALGSVSAAKADIIIVPPSTTVGGVQAIPETPLDGSMGFPCTGCTTNPVTTFGYTSTAVLVRPRH